MVEQGLRVAIIAGGAARMTSMSATTATGAGQSNVCFEPLRVIDDPYAV